MASTDATPIPIKNQAYRVTFPIFDADGDLVTGAAGLDSEISKDAGAFADCTNEATEIAASSGMYYLDLTAAEMNADTVAVIVKTSTSGAKTTPIVLYPAENTDIPVNVKAISDDTTAPDNLELMYDGTGYAGGTTKLDVDVVSMGAGVVTAAAVATGAIDADAIAADAIGSSELAATAVQEIADQVWDEAQADHVAAGSFGEVATEVASILADTGELQTDWVNGGRLDLLIDAILADTGTDGVVISAATANQIADALLKRDWNSVSGESARSALNALRLLRNKASISGTTLTVTKEDDTTSAWTATVTTDASADPVTAVDPA